VDPLSLNASTVLAAGRGHSVSRPRFQEHCSQQELTPNIARRSLVRGVSQSVFRREAAYCDRLMRENLSRVFGESDPSRRMLAIEELWTASPVAYDCELSGAGRDAISHVAGRFLERLDGATCEVRGPICGHSGAIILRWETRHEGRDPRTGCHMAFLRGGRIDSLYLFDEQR
jgi:hypothetical protein